MSEINVDPLIERYQRYIQRCREQGRAIVAYYCPSCQYPIDTLRPSQADEPYDSAADCPYCLALHYYVAWADGTVQVAYPLVSGIRNAEVRHD